MPEKKKKPVTVTERKKRRQRVSTIDMHNTPETRYRPRPIKPNKRYPVRKK